MALGGSSELNLNADNPKPGAALSEQTLVYPLELEGCSSSMTINSSNNLMAYTPSKHLSNARLSSSLNTTPWFTQTSKAFDINFEFSSSSKSTLLPPLASSSFMSSPMDFNPSMAPFTVNNNFTWGMVDCSTSDKEELNERRNRKEDGLN
ncbi:hypothetical protein HRI_002651000 [Hibiscus trionum]|uniref:Uncharacterized protein n=1 Tax=Hibiscus trionum TaxID=183268 RepID=A0A9W7I658_HIBTR|nr:hypothetical protein HRI_002651000 [Hibiscus trionum]